MSGHRYYRVNMPKVTRPARRRLITLHDNIAHNAELFAHQRRISGGVTFADPPAFHDSDGTNFDAWVAAENLQFMPGDALDGN